MGRSVRNQIRAFFADDEAHSKYECAYTALMKHVMDTQPLFRRFRIYEKRLDDSIKEYQDAKTKSALVTARARQQTNKWLNLYNLYQDLTRKAALKEKELALVVEQATPEMMLAWQKRNLRQLKQFIDSR